MNARSAPHAFIARPQPSALDAVADARLPNYRAGILGHTFDPTARKRLESISLNKPGQSESNQCS